MKTIFISFISGLVFSIGLIISQMINPSKVRGFLNIFGDWDFTLALVMGGAVITNFITFKLILKKSPLIGEKFYLPVKNTIDRRLVIGSSLFGIGWGLIGICPGPAIVNIATFQTPVLIFVAAMLTGMLIGKKV